MMKERHLMVEVDIEIMSWRVKEHQGLVANYQKP